MKTKHRVVPALLCVLLSGFSLLPAQAEGEVRDSLVRIRLDSESPGILYGAKYIPQIQVYEVTELQGVIIDAQGHIVSYLGNFWPELMITQAGLRVSVQDSVGRSHSAELVGVDERTALVVLKSKRLKGRPVGVSSGLSGDYLDSVSRREGDWVFTSRTVVGVSEELPPLQGVQIVVSDERTGSWISQGDFLLDRQRQLFGIFTRNNPHPFSKRIQVWQVLPSNVVIDSVSQIVKHKRNIKAGWLGIVSHSNPNELIIDQVVPESPAERAGLQQNDVIVRLDGKPVSRLGDLAQAIRWKGAGGKAALSVRRDGRIQELSALLTERPEERARLSYRLELPRLWNEEGEPEQGVRLYRTVLPPSLGLGLVVDPLTPQLAEYFRCPKSQGLLVTSVQPSSPAHHVGFSAGDVLIRINGQDVSSYDEVEQSLRVGHAGVAFIEFVRNGRIQTRKISLP